MLAKQKLVVCLKKSVSYCKVSVKKFEIMFRCSAQNLERDLYP
jgi:hypothetical protein